MKRPARILISAAAGLALVAAGTAAGAAITGPIDGNKVIYGCFTTKAINGSHALVLQDVGTTCPSGTTAINWNEQGSQGPAGPAGPTGPAGPKGDPGANGTSVTSQSLPVGDPNCANGGSSFTAASGTTYACNGAPGKDATGVLWASVAADGTILAGGSGITSITHNTGDYVVEFNRDINNCGALVTTNPRANGIKLALQGV